MARDYKFEFRIVKHYGDVSVGVGGWKKEVNLVAFNDGMGQCDIRDWSPDHTNMGKGLHLKRDEIVPLIAALQACLEDDEYAEVDAQKKKSKSLPIFSSKEKQEYKSRKKETE